MLLLDIMYITWYLSCLKFQLILMSAFFNLCHLYIYNNTSNEFLYKFAQFLFPIFANKNRTAPNCHTFLSICCVKYSDHRYNKFIKKKMWNRHIYLTLCYYFQFWIQIPVLFFSVFLNCTFFLNYTYCILYCICVLNFCFFALFS